MSNIRIKGRIERTPIEYNIDTGALRAFVFKKIFASNLDKPTLGHVSAIFVVADGPTFECSGEGTMVLIFGDDAFEHLVFVRDVKHNLLGEDFIERYRCGKSRRKKYYHKRYLSTFRRLL